MRPSIPRFPAHPAVDSRYPTTFAAVPQSWTLTGTEGTIESATNYTLWVSAVGSLVSYSVVLPAGYTAGSTRYPVVWNSHGQVNPTTTGNGYISTIWPASYNIARVANKMRDHITVFLCIGENSMGTNLPDGASLYESIMLAVHKHVHATFRTLGATGRYNVLMGFSMGARASLYWLFKYAKMYHEGRHPWRFGGAAVFAAPSYDEDTNYDTAGLHDFSLPCISPDDTFTATELAIWATKCAQTWIDLDALDGLLVMVGYSASDAVLAAAGDDWETRMNAEGVTHRFYDTITNNSDAAFTHSKTNYWSSTNSDTIGGFYSAVEEVFAGAVGPHVPGIYAIDGAGGTTTGSGFLTRDGAIVDREFVSGYAWRQPWRVFEATDGVYDWSGVDSIIASLEAIGQKLSWTIMPSEPSYVEAGAAATWANPNTLGQPDSIAQTTAVPWDAYLLTKYTAFLEAAAAHLVPCTTLGFSVPLYQHPVLVRISLVLAGYSVLRENPGMQVNDIPGYSRALFTGAVMDQTAAVAAAFPGKRLSYGLWSLIDDTSSPKLSDLIQDDLITAYGNKMAFFEDNLAANGSGGTTPTTTFAQPIARAFSLAAPTEFQALDSWSNSFAGDPSKVEGGSPALGMAYGSASFGATYFEIYSDDLENAEFQDGLEEWAGLLAAI